MGRVCHGESMSWGEHNGIWNHVRLDLVRRPSGRSFMAEDMLDDILSIYCAGGGSCDYHGSLNNPIPCKHEIIVDCLRRSTAGRRREAS